jgi:hypothetical protein
MGFDVFLNALTAEHLRWICEANSLSGYENVTRKKPLVNAIFHGTSVDVAQKSFSNKRDKRRKPAKSKNTKGKKQRVMPASFSMDLHDKEREEEDTVSGSSGDDLNTPGEEF